MRIIFACGGTAGHINPALAVAGRIKEIVPDSEFLFIGAVGQMETDLVPRAGYKIETVRVRGLSREKTVGGFLHNLSAAWHLLKSTIKAKKIIKRFKPDVVVGTGGYVCFPVLKAASLLGIPTAVHESNAYPGLTTKMLSGIVDVIMLGFEESRKHYRNPEKTVVTGTPVRGEFALYSKSDAKAQLGIPENKPLIVSVWGSLGAENMNDVVCNIIELAGEKPEFALIHSAGVEGYAKMAERLRTSAPDCKERGMDVREYIYDMPRVMAAADIVMCRAGASTISELTYMHKPAIFVPSPFVTNNHQFKNAKVVEEAGGALIFEEGKFAPKELYDAVMDILSSPEKIECMSKAMERLAKPEATDAICSEIFKLCPNSMELKNAE